MTDTQTMHAEFEAWASQFGYKFDKWGSTSAYASDSTNIAWSAFQAAWTRKPAAQVAGAVHQWRHRPKGGPIEPKWIDATKEEAYSRVDEHYEARTLYTHPEPEPVQATADIDEMQGFTTLMAKWKSLEGSDAGEIYSEICAFINAWHVRQTPEPDATKVVSVPTWHERLGGYPAIQMPGSKREVAMIAEITELRAALAADRKRT